jgi:hypothetical protein
MPASDCDLPHDARLVAQAQTIIPHAMHEP